MYSIGTRVQLDGVTTAPYSTNTCGGERNDGLANAMTSLSIIGMRYFPNVRSVIQDLEGNTGLRPVYPMDGAPRPRDGRVQRVGNPINISCNLENSSHYDIHDASQGFSVWTEEKPGVVRKWFLNVHGKRLDGTYYAGVAIQMGDGTGIGWDGRDVMHNTLS
jgi:hypothetical protein